MADTIILNSESSYKLLDLVSMAYARLKKDPVKFGLAESAVFDESAVATAIVNNAKDLGVEGISLEQVRAGMEAAKKFAPDGSSGAAALNVVATDTSVHSAIEESKTEFYNKLDREGKTILDSKQDYANLLRIVSAYGEISSHMEEYGLTRDSSADDWKNAIKTYGGIALTDADFEKAFANAGKVAANGETGINAVATLHEKKNQPIIDSYKKFDARSKGEIESLGKKHADSRSAWLASRKANRKAWGARIGSTIGKVLMFLAVPGALAGLFFGAAAVAGGIAALSSVASLGIVFSTGIIGYIGYAIFKKPFAKLWDKLTESYIKAKALHRGDENTVGSHKNLAKTKQLFRSQRMAHEMANAKENGVSKSDETLINEMLAGETIDIAGIHVEEGLSAEHYADASARSGAPASSASPVVAAPEEEREDVVVGAPRPEEAPREEAPVAGDPEVEHSRGLTGGPAEEATPETPKTKTDEEVRNTHGVIVGDTVSMIHDVAEDEQEHIVGEATNEYTQQVIDEFEASHPGVKIREEDRQKIVEAATGAYADYLSYDDARATSRLRTKKRKAAEANKLTDTPVVVTVQKADGSLDSVTLNVGGEAVANTVRTHMEPVAEVNAAERKVRAEMQGKYAEAITGSAAAQDFVDQKIVEIATEHGVDVNSLRAYLSNKLGEDARYVHAGVYKTEYGKDGKHVELTNDELNVISGALDEAITLGQNTTERWNELQKEREFVRTTTIPSAYQSLVTDKIVEQAIAAYVEENYVGKDEKEKAQLVADLKKYYLSDKPYADGKLEIMDLAAIAGGKVGKYGDKKDIDTKAQYVKAGINSQVKKIVKAATDEVERMNQDRTHYDELQKFQKKCDAVGLANDNRKDIIAAFLDDLSSEAFLQKQLGPENLKKLQELIKKNPKFAQKVANYIKNIPTSQRGQEAAVAGIVAGNGVSHEDERFVLDLCYNVYMPFKEEKRKKREAEIAAQKAEEQKQKGSRRFIRKIKLGAPTSNPTNVEETPHEEAERGEE